MLNWSSDRPPPEKPRAAGQERKRRSADVVVVSLAILLAACGAEVSASPTFPSPVEASQSSPTTTPSAMVSNTPDPVELQSPPVLSVEEVPLMCGSPLAFSVEALAAVPGAETADHPAARNLRRLLADGSLPDRSGWRLVVFNEDGVLFLLPGTRAEGVSFWNAEFGPAEADWQPVRWGQCEIQPAFEGTEAARWELAPGEEIGPDTASFEAHVFEQACASGASPEGRIVGPSVVLLDDTVIVILATRPPQGPQTCEPGPPASVRVQLPEPLGDRQLLDGSSFPAEPRD